MTVLKFAGLKRSVGGDWTQDELASLYRAQSFLQKSGLSVGLEQGITDIGEPWCVYYDMRSEEVIAHFARIDRRYVIAGSVLQSPVWGKTLRDAIDTFYQAVDKHVEFSESRKKSDNSNVVMHPATKLIFSLSALFFLLHIDKHEAQAAEAGNDTQAHSLLSQAMSMNWVPRPFGPAESSTNHLMIAALMGFYLASSASQEISSSPVGDKADTDSLSGAEPAHGAEASSVAIAGNEADFRPGNLLSEAEAGSAGAQEMRAASGVEHELKEIHKIAVDVSSVDAVLQQADIKLETKFDTHNVTLTLAHAEPDLALTGSTQTGSPETQEAPKSSSANTTPGETDAEATQPTLVSINKIDTSAASFFQTYFSDMDTGDHDIKIVTDLAFLHQDVLDAPEDLLPQDAPAPETAPDPAVIVVNASNGPDLENPTSGIFLPVADQMQEQVISDFIANAGDVDLYLYEGNIVIIDRYITETGTNDFYVQTISFDDQSQISLIGLAHDAGVDFV